MNQSIIDLAKFGVLLRSARLVAGYDRASDFSRALSELGVKMSDDVIYNIERGEQAMRVDQYFAALMLLKPKGGHDWFSAAFRDDLRSWADS
ncbi:MAG: hypothetical protein FDZ75_01465 [Actinobacteria bacterium]|nr:MAG: hypothetical protein FDZ75_01465 [Actinomycetota bacterium]